MEDFIIEGSTGTFFTPSVKLEAATGQCSISGESYLEDAFDFYDKMIEWVENYFSQGGNKIHLAFRLTYFNTSSSRAILDLIKTLKKFQDEGKEVSIDWYYPNPDDDEMLMEAEDFMDESGMQFNLIEYNL